MDNFRFVRKRGEGTFAEVWEVEDKKSGERAALKILKKKFASVIDVFQDAEFRTLRCFSCRPAEVSLAASSAPKTTDKDFLPRHRSLSPPTSIDSPSTDSFDLTLPAKESNPCQTSSAACSCLNERSKVQSRAAWFHPHLTGLYDAFFEPSDGRVVFVLELLGQSLLDEIVDRKANRAKLQLPAWKLRHQLDGLAANRERLPLFHEGELRMLLFQILSGISDMHARGIFHRDIKPENILFKHTTTPTDLEVSRRHGKTGLPVSRRTASQRHHAYHTHTQNPKLRLKLADFGSCQFTAISKDTAPETPAQGASPASKNTAYTEYIATRWYRSPECLLTAGHYGPPMDLWATGCVAIELLTGHPFLPGENESHQLQLIHNIFGPPSRCEVETQIGPIGTHIASSADFASSPERGSTDSRSNPTPSPPSCRELSSDRMIRRSSALKQRDQLIGSGRWKQSDEIATTTGTASDDEGASPFEKRIFLHQRRTIIGAAPTFPKAIHWKRQVIPHIFLGGNFMSESLSDLLHRLLAYFPSQRITARQALEHPFFSDVLLR